MLDWLVDKLRNRGLEQMGSSRWSSCDNSSTDCGWVYKRRLRQVQARCFTPLGSLGAEELLKCVCVGWCVHLTERFELPLAHSVHSLFNKILARVKFSPPTPLFSLF